MAIIFYAVQTLQKKLKQILTNNLPEISLNSNFDSAQLGEVMDTLRKNKLEISRANQACEELKSRIKMYTDTQNSPNQAQIDRLQKNVTQLEKSLSTKFEELQARKPMSRTVSLGPDTGDVKKLRADQAEMVKKLEDFKAQISPVMNEFRTGNLMSPAMSGTLSRI